ncbi:MAG: glycosyltransferase [Candidatus Omnitrophota bacterium]
MIYVLLPAYNEEKSLSVLLPKIDHIFKSINKDYALIVCNDGSHDSTGEILKEFAKKLPLEILVHKINRGLGETSRDLFERAAELSKPEDVIIRMDCDDTHEPKFVLGLLSKLDEGFDVVIASRFQPGGGQRGLSAYKTFISLGANIFMKIIFPMKGIREYSCGFRAYRAKIIKTAVDIFGNDFIQLKGLGFTCTLEKLVKLKMLGARFTEVPFLLRYDQKKSKSKMVGSITMFGYLTMAIFYHWPWGGWRMGYRKKIRKHIHKR